ncbi:MAG: hypothetical protein ABI844_07295 [Saprospiraceae bacterium]
MEKEYFYDHVEDYLGKRLDATSMKYFENGVREHPEWMEEYRFNSTLKKALRTDFRKKLETVNLNQKKTKPFTRFFTLYKPIAIAASLVLIVSVGYWQFIKSKKIDESILFEKYYKAPTSLSPELSGQRGESNVYADSTIEFYLVKADEYYVKNDLPSAIKILQSTSTNIQEDKIHYQLGLLYQKNKEYLKSNEEFEKSGEYKLNDVQWNKALNYLATKEIDKCLTALSNIPKESRWSTNARELGYDLKK